MLKLDFLGRYDVADMLMLAASVVVVVTILIAICCQAAPWREKTQDVSKKERIVTRAEHRRLIARRLFDALSAQYPNKYVNLVLPRNETDDVPDLTVPKSEG
jgi:hypothetical protein